MTNIELEINGAVETLEQALDHHAIAEDIRPKTPDSSEETVLYSAYDCMEAAAGRLHEVHPGVGAPAAGAHKGAARRDDHPGADAADGRRLRQQDRETGAYAQGAQP